MNPRCKLGLLLTLDLLFLLLLLLFMVYFGLSHVFLLGLGILLLLLSLYDCRTGRLSSVTALLFGLPEVSDNGKLNWLPILLSLVLVFYSAPILKQHGLVNTAQRWAMQSGLFQRLALWSAAIAGLVIAAAVTLAGLERRK
ncbi:MAG: hypothetical protein AB1767_06370 [Bacillota bacterium]